MNGDQHNGDGPTDGGLGADEGPDTGQPIQGLAGLEEMPSQGFFPRLRRRIDRQALGMNLFTLVWSGSALLVLELVDVVFGLFRPDTDDEGGSA